MRSKAWFFYGSTMVFCFIATGFIWYLSREVARFRDAKPIQDVVVSKERVPEMDARIVDEMKTRVVTKTVDYLESLQRQVSSQSSIIREQQAVIHRLEKQINSASSNTSLLDIARQPMPAPPDDTETMIKLNTKIDDYKARLSTVESENRSLSDTIVQLKEKLEESERRNLVRKMAVEQESSSQASALYNKYSHITDETVTTVEAWRQAQRAETDIRLFLVVHRLSDDHELRRLHERLKKYVVDPVEYVRLNTGDVIIGRSKDVTAYTETFTLVFRGKVMGEKSFDNRKVQARRMATTDEISQ